MFSVCMSCPEQAYLGHGWSLRPLGPLPLKAAILANVLKAKSAKISGVDYKLLKHTHMLTLLNTQNTYIDKNNMVSRCNGKKATDTSSHLLP